MSKAIKKHIQIKDSYKIWKPKTMIRTIIQTLVEMNDLDLVMSLKYELILIEWWIHNIGYYLTKPLVFIPFFKSLNLRFKDVDLMIKVKSEGEG